MNDFVKITLAANKKLAHLAQKTPSKSIFYSVKGGGCNGFTYKTNMVKNSYKYNLAPMTYSPTYLMHCVDMYDYKLYICEYSFKHLVNSTIHWEKNFMNEKFIFDNPNAKYAYKCQNSFVSKYT